MTASWCFNVAGPGLVRVSTSPIAQGWRRIASRAEEARRRISACQSPPTVGQVDLAEDDVNDAIKDLILVGHVVVNRHRLDLECVRE